MGECGKADCVKMSNAPRCLVCDVEEIRGSAELLNKLTLDERYQLGAVIAGLPISDHTGIGLPGCVHCDPRSWIP